MPTVGSIPRPWDNNPKLWCECRKKVEAAMIAAGWNPKARKFAEVAGRKQCQMYNQIAPH